MFDFYFQSGEFGGSGGTDWWSVSATFLGSLIGAGIGVGGAIWVFKKGKEVEAQVREEEKLRREQQQIQHFYFLIRESLATIKANFDGLDSMREGYEKTSKTYFPKYVLLENNFLTRLIDKINQDSLYETLTNQSNISRINSIYALIDNIKMQYSKLEKLMQDATKEDFSLKMKFIESFQKNINYAMETLVIESPDTITYKNTQEILRKYTDNEINTCTNDGKVDFSLYDKKIIIPLILAITDGNEIQNKRYLKQLMQLKKCRSLLTPLVSHNEQAYLAIHDIKNNIEKTISELKPLIFNETN
ncbi:hypothetical protein BWI93_03200 [Siphonobacter sp. BAB-5385]|uniref:hypothetical protein n=1 Tax=Siphonobacter sp. BAB-5385 TaxID=1864822 RepID=UPI000B9E90E8|nr:hypothetical protein [Siphonobacter sp. BAB-5385]OZI09603.1 hypothetical protein BWI93_03200 [Siphonobacter sp. BAB-5385]